MSDALRNKLFAGFLVVFLPVVAACSGGGTGEPAATADEALDRVTRGLADGRPEVAWQALPASYQDDITEVVHAAAAGVDPELWNRSFTVLQKLGTLLSDKRDLIFEHPMIAQGMAGQEDPEEAWDAAVAAFEIVVRSDLADLDEVKKLDIGAFLAGTGADLMKRIAAASALAPDDPWNKQMKTLRATKASVRSAKGDTATLSIKRPGKPASEEHWVRVEGKWIPQGLADAWPETIAEVQRQVAEVSGQENPEDKQNTLRMLSMVESALDGMLAADTPGQFNAAVGAAMGAAMTAMTSRIETESMSLPVTAPVETLPPTRRERRQEYRSSLSRRIIGADGTIPVDQAERFVGQTLQVTSSSGIDCRCRLAGIENGVLVFERNFANGSVSFELSPREIESLRVVDS